mmetsp:Transcript_120942/g.353338  ORF Transcript_120942/g.353338 Transcript_120942/m.353338 type:complete len:243 (-) Transcript_120942:153-881(-)
MPHGGRIRVCGREQELERLPGPPHRRRCRLAVVGVGPGIQLLARRHQDVPAPSDHPLNLGDGLRHSEAALHDDAVRRCEPCCCPSLKEDCLEGGSNLGCTLLWHDNDHTIAGSLSSCQLVDATRDKAFRTENDCWGASYEHLSIHGQLILKNKDVCTTLLLQLLQLVVVLSYHVPHMPRFYLHSLDLTSGHSAVSLHKRSCTGVILHPEVSAGLLHHQGCIVLRAFCLIRQHLIRFCNTLES